MPAIPKREDELAQPRSRQRKDARGIATKRGTMRDVVVPEPHPEWHPIAANLYRAALASGQADFYQSSDVMMLYTLCEDLSQYKQSGRRSSQMLAAIMGGLSSLMLTEGDRRKVRIELHEAERPEQTTGAKVIGLYEVSLAKPPARRGARTPPSD